MFFQVLELETHDEDHVLCIDEVDVGNFIKPSVRA